MQFNLTILGCNSAMPAYGRVTTSQALKVDQDIYLIDAGEGVQMQLAKFGIKRSRIKAIFISHLHGDHILGLPGLLTSFSLMERKEPLSIIGPKGLEEFINCFLKISESHISFPIEYSYLDNTEEKTIYYGNKCEVISFPVAHRIPTWGYVFKEKPPSLKIRPDKIEKYALGIEEIKRAKSNLPVQSTRFGVLLPSQLCYPMAPTRSYAYCADTVYTDSFLKSIKDVSLLYHEATYLHELKEKATLRGHSTAKEAALCAKEAKAKKLLIGHYSSRYKDLNPLLKEARSVFRETYLALDGDVHEISN